MPTASPTNLLSLMTDLYKLLALMLGPGTQMSAASLTFPCSKQAALGRAVNVVLGGSLKVTEY